MHSFIQLSYSVKYRVGTGKVSMWFAPRVYMYSSVVQYYHLLSRSCQSDRRLVVICIAHSAWSHHIVAALRFNPYVLVCDILVSNMPSGFLFASTSGNATLSSSYSAVNLMSLNMLLFVGLFFIKRVFDNNSFQIGCQSSGEITYLLDS